MPMESGNSIFLFSKTFPISVSILRGFNFSSLLFVQEPVSCWCSDVEGLLATASAEEGLIFPCFPCFWEDSHSSSVPHFGNSLLLSLSPC